MNKGEINHQLCLGIFLKDFLSYTLYHLHDFGGRKVLSNPLLKLQSFWNIPKKYIVLVLNNLLDINKSLTLNISLLGTDVAIFLVIDLNWFPVNYITLQ